MTDDKKPKIDLKARLGKIAAGGQGPAIPPGSTRSPSMRPGPAMGTPPPFSTQSVSRIDPTNPLAAVATPFQSQIPIAQAPQTIEVDESQVRQARKSGRNQGLVIGTLLAVALGGVGYVAGGASEQGAGRKRGQADAADLAENVKKATDQLKDLADKVEAGRTMLRKDQKFPVQLTKDLGGINIDFDGSKLAGRRFSGFPQDVTFGLVDFVAGVQSLNDRKGVVAGLLTRLQKPLTDLLAIPPGQQTVAQIVVIDRDKAEPPNFVAALAPLSTPIQFTGNKVELPPEFAVASQRGNVTVPRYTTGEIAAKPAAFYVAPQSFERLCPNETSGQSAQLLAQLANLIRDIRGEQSSGGEAINDAKPGLLERADKLSTGLTKVATQQ